MNADDMRTELESFLNEGLDKGWCGWPTKHASAHSAPSPDRSMVSLAVPVIGGDGHSVLSLWRSFPWSLRSLEDSEVACDMDLRPLDVSLVGGSQGKRLFSHH